MGFCTFLRIEFLTSKPLKLIHVRLHQSTTLTHLVAIFKEKTAKIMIKKTRQNSISYNVATHTTLFLFENTVIFLLQIEFVSNNEHICVTQKQIYKVLEVNCQHKKHLMNKADKICNMISF